MHKSGCKTSQREDFKALNVACYGNVIEPKPTVTFE